MYVYGSFHLLIYSKTLTTMILGFEAKSALHSAHYYIVHYVVYFSKLRVCQSLNWLYSIRQKSRLTHGSVFLCL